MIENHLWVLVCRYLAGPARRTVPGTVPGGDTIVGLSQAVPRPMCSNPPRAGGASQLVNLTRRVTWMSEMNTTPECLL